MQLEAMTLYFTGVHLYLIMGGGTHYRIEVKDIEEAELIISELPHKNDQSKIEKYLAESKEWNYSLIYKGTYSSNEPLDFYKKRKIK